MTTVYGVAFKRLYSNTKFYKLTCEDENHNGFQFQTGLNIDTVPFNPTGECSKGGLYFTEQNKVGKWMFYKDVKYIRPVIILDDSLIYIEEDKFKADKFYLGEKKLIEDFELWNDETFCKLAVQENGYALKYVKEPTEEIKKLAEQQIDTFWYDIHATNNYALPFAIRKHLYKKYLD